MRYGNNTSITSAPASASTSVFAFDSDADCDSTTSACLAMRVPAAVLCRSLRRAVGAPAHATLGKAVAAAAGEEEAAGGARGGPVSVGAVAVALLRDSAAEAEGRGAEGARVEVEGGREEEMEVTVRGG
jgi:hypothetical protein